MNNIELYINNRLCEIANAEKLGIRLNRLLINPAELNTKDAQYSYSITIPSTNTNDEIFGFANVEEVKDKFNHDYNALLYVDSVLIFNGKFRISEIDKDGNFKGNLLIPAKKTIKEVFGDIKMNELKTEWSIPFKEMVSSMNHWNTKKGTPECIFPYVLYGLLPKVPKDSQGNYSAKDVWDETVRLGIEDFPPSINCLKAIDKIFSTLKDKEGKAQRIGGSAFDDVRLQNLYMSYSNPTDYRQEWNWGDLATMSVEGYWNMAKQLKLPNPLLSLEYRGFERQIVLNEDEYGGYYNVNLFNSNNATLLYSDTGTNITYSEYEDKYLDKPYTRKNLALKVPRSGYYKVKLTCNEFKLNSDGKHLQFYDNDKKFTTTKQSHRDRNNRFDRSRYEIQVLRDFGSGEFNNANIVGFYNSPQFPQTSFDDNGKFPKYYPKAKGAMVIDPSVNQNFICGLHWGRHEDDYNPKDSASKCNYMFIANGFSWNKFFSQEKKISSVYSSWGRDGMGNYWCWGTKEEKDQDEEDDVALEEEKDEDNIEEELPRPIWFDKPVKKRYARFNDYTDSFNFVEQEGDVLGRGAVECIIWLDEGESLTVGIAGDMGDMRRGSNHHSEFDQWIVLIDNVKFKLEVEPFRVDFDWNNFLSNGSYNSKQLLSWNIDQTNTGNFQKDKINLVNFLPSEQKVDEWLDNFCKAFNLQLSQINNDRFELNIKQSQVKTHISSVVDLDSKASVFRRSNRPLDLPAIFDLGFKINEEEEGFDKSKDNGGGRIETGSLDGTTVNQKSTFSYNWFKTINQKISGNTMEQIRIPIISNKEVWEDDLTNYREMMRKSYTNYSQRFWYKDGDKIYDLDAIWKTSTTSTTGDKVKHLLVPRLTTSMDEGIPLLLSYKNEPSSIYQTYFNIIATNESNYTDIECYLSPDEYEKLDGARLVKLNNDLYYAASIEGYDPLGRNKTKLRLIRKI